MAERLINRSIGLDISLNNITDNINNNYYSKNYIDSNIYTRPNIDSKFSNVYTKVQIDSSLSNIYTKPSIDNSYGILYNRVQYNNLDSYYNKNYIDSSFSQVYSKNQTDNLFSNYYNKNQADSSLNSLSNILIPIENVGSYYNKNYIDASFSSIYSKNQLGNIFANYYNKSNIDASFSSINNTISTVYNSDNYYSKSRIDSSFSNIYTKSKVDSSFNNYYNRIGIDSSFSQVYNKSQTDSLFSYYYAKGLVDSSFSQVYTKTEANNLFTLANLLNNSQYDENIDISLNSLRLNIDSSYSSIKTYANDTFYSKIDMSNNLVDKVKFDSSFSQLYLKNYIDSSFSQVYTKSYIDSSLNSTYVLKSYIDSSLNSLAKKTYVDSSLNNYYIKNTVDSSLNRYSLIANVDSSFSQVYTKSYVDSSLNSNYVLKTYVDSSLNNNYVLKTYIDSSLNNYYSKNSVDTSLNRYTQKTYIDSSLNTNYALKSYVDTSLNNLYISKRAGMNYVWKRDISYQNIMTSSTAANLTSIDISTNGYPVLVIAYGDGIPSTSGAWLRFTILRNGVAIANTDQLESSDNGESCPYSLHVVDTPTTGNQTYTISVLVSSGNSSVFNFGTTTGPTLSAIELTGPRSQGVYGTNIQNGIVVNATTTSPNFGTRSTDKIEYQRLGNKIKLTYRLSSSGNSSGSGDYLLNLPIGMRFNTTYNPFNTGIVWNTSQQTYAQYLINACGTSTISGGWNFSGGYYIVPYDNNGSGSTGRFRVLTTYNGNTTQFLFWSPALYSANTEQINILTFEIWV